MTTMKSKITLLLLVLGCTVASPGTLPAAEVGFSYGREMRSHTELEQYEIFDRHPLPYTADWGDTVKVSTAVELGAALIHYYGADDAVTGRFSATPMVIVSPLKNFNILAGIGAGFMVGQTEFGKHDLSGPLLFTGKVGLQLLLGEKWGIEYTFFHQSNGSIYDHNDSLNMNQLAVTFRF